MLLLLCAPFLAVAQESSDSTRAAIAPQWVLQAELVPLRIFPLAHTVRYLTGLPLVDFGGIGGLQTINIQCLSTNSTSVSYDGIRIDGAQNGQVSLGRFSLDNVQAIALHEIQKSAALQSAQDFGVAPFLEITSRRPAFHEDRRTNLHAEIRGGSFGVLNPSILYEHRLASKLSTSFNAEWRTTHGQYKYHYRRLNLAGELLYDTVAKRRHSDVNTLRLEGALHGELPGGEWQMRLYNYNSERGLPGAIVNNAWRRGERLWERNSFVQITLQSRPIERYQTRAALKYAYDFTHYINRDAQLAKVNNIYRQGEFYLSTSHLLSVLTWLDVTAAYDFRMNTLAARSEVTDAELFGISGSRRFEHHGAVALTACYAGLSAQTSLLAFFMHSPARGSSELGKHAALQPAVLLSYLPYAPLGLSLKAFYKRSVRLPSFNDLFYTGGESVHLVPEHLTQHSVGLHWERVRKEALFPYLQLAAYAFYHNVQDKIIAYPRNQLFRWTMANVDRVKVRGIDAKLRLVLAPEVRSTVVLAAQYTFQETHDVSDPNDSRYENQLPNVPRHSAAASLGFTYHYYSLYYSVLYAGERYNQPENIIYNYMRPWHSHDVAFLVSVPFGPRRFRVGLEVTNLLNGSGELILNYPLPGRTFRFSLRGEF